MKNSIKAFGSRFAALLLCLCMVFTMIPSAYAADEEDDDLVGANIQDGVLVGYYGPGGDIVIPNTVTAIAGEAFKGNKKITSVTIPGSVQEIGYSAFEGCPNLEKILFSNPKDGAQLTIRVSAFMDCPKLTECTIPAVAKYVTGNVFKGCSSMTEIKVDPANPYYFTQNGVMFGPWVEDGKPQYEDENLALIAYPCGNTATSYTIPSTVNGKTVNQIWASSFRKAANLTHIEIPSTCVKLGGDAFDHSGLTEITIPATVTTIGSGLFEGCANLTDVTYEGRVESLGYALYQDCTSLQRINFNGGAPSSLDTYAFKNCLSLSNLILPEGLLSIKLGFDGCTNLQRVFIPSSVISFPSEDNDYFNPFPAAPSNLIVYVVKGSSGEKWAVNHAEEFGWNYEVVSGADALATLDAGTFSLVDMGNKVKLDGKFKLGTTLRVTPVYSGAQYDAFQTQANGSAFAVYQINLEPTTAILPESMDLQMGLPSGLTKNSKLYTYRSGNVEALTSAYISGSVTASVEELGYFALIDSTSTPVENPDVPTGISLSASTATVEAGKRLQLTATVTPDTATDKSVTWTTSAPAVATVSKGVVTGVAAGTATITASTVNGLTATCTVTVTGGTTPDPEPQPTADISAESAGIRVDGKTSDGRISFPLSLTDPSRVAAIQIWFTTDGSDVSVSGLGGFTPVGAVSTSQVNGQTVYTAVLSYLGGSEGTLSAEGRQDVAQIAVRGDKPTVTVTDLKISGWTTDGDPSTVAYGTIKNGIDPSKATYSGEKNYDVNGDGVVDLLDITTAQLYYRAAKGDSNWSAASRCDFNDDNVIDVADFVEIWLHYTVRG